MTVIFSGYIAPGIPLTTIPLYIIYHTNKSFYDYQLTISHLSCSDPDVKPLSNEQTNNKPTPPYIKPY